MRDPRKFDFNSLANFTRGWLEYLVQYNSDCIFTPSLLQGRDSKEDATLYTFKLRPGVAWNNSEPFTAANVARNIERWCDRTIEANSIAIRFGTIVDADSGKMMAGAVSVDDDHTVTIALPRLDISRTAGMSDSAALSLGLIGAAAFSSIWAGFLVAGNFFCYWFCHEGGQTTHVHILQWD